ncbi:ribosome maturation factor RimM [Desulfuromonas versatilis]|uniref:Ribosome maturation factor RimM n=1 Tax=Desulfuromonas versatilis TaxID=2802975 RepID=A0ABN6DV77_9BACT|nr:ribosome maturation factor RimM [Desulfuromonas versatilis]BCR03942.1 ribosome maturation factor RimM [Desulfuromonas versatilis]
MAVRVGEWFCAGVVRGTHGLRGDLKVRPVTDDSASLLEAGELEFRKADGTATRQVPVRSSLHKGDVLLRLKGLEHIDEVQHLVGSEVYMPYRDLPDLEEDEFYWYQLEGLRVLDRTRGELGTLEEMFTTPAHDIYVVQGPYGEVLIPVVEQMIVRVDLVAGCIEVDLPEGLVPGSDEV